MSVIWTEKYRPRSFEQVIGQDSIIEKVSALAKDEAMPHMLFAGPAGTGKTSLSLIIAKTLFGEGWKNNFLELNASDERGIDIIRVKVKDFARTRAIGNIPFKLIYLDECDALTRDAQQALRRTMENYTKTCRFILSCNYSSKIIDPIQSRCAVFRFKNLSEKDTNKIIEKVAESEGLTIDVSAKKALFSVSEGDSRRLINIMQSASISKTINEDSVYSLGAKAKPEEIGSVLKKALTGDFSESRDLLLSTMLTRGLSGVDVIKQIQSEIHKLDIDSRAKMGLIKTCAEIEFRISEGSDEFIQLEALLAAIGSEAK